MFTVEREELAIQQAGGRQTDRRLSESITVGAAQAGSRRTTGSATRERRTTGSETIAGAATTYEDTENSVLSSDRQRAASQQLWAGQRERRIEAIAEHEPSAIAGSAEAAPEPPGDSAKPFLDAFRVTNLIPDCPHCGLQIKEFNLAVCKGCNQSLDQRQEVAQSESPEPQDRLTAAIEAILHCGTCQDCQRPLREVCATSADIRVCAKHCMSLCSRCAPKYTANRDLFSLSPPDSGVLSEHELEVLPKLNEAQLDIRKGLNLHGVAGVLRAGMGEAYAQAGKKHGPFKNQPEEKAWEQSVQRAVFESPAMQRWRTLCWRDAVAQSRCDLEITSSGTPPSRRSNSAFGDTDQKDSDSSDGDLVERTIKRLIKHHRLLPSPPMTRMPLLGHRASGLLPNAETRCQLVKPRVIIRDSRQPVFFGYENLDRDQERTGLRWYENVNDSGVRGKELSGLQKDKGTLRFADVRGAYQSINPYHWTGRGDYHYRLTIVSDPKKGRQKLLTHLEWSETAYGKAEYHKWFKYMIYIAAANVRTSASM